MVVFLRRRGYFYESFSSASGQRRHGNTNSWSCLVGPDFFNLYSSYRIEEWNACLEDELPIASFRLFSDSARSGWSPSTVFFPSIVFCRVDCKIYCVYNDPMCTITAQQFNWSFLLPALQLNSNVSKTEKEDWKQAHDNCFVPLFPIVTNPMSRPILRNLFVVSAWIRHDGTRIGLTNNLTLAIYFTSRSTG